MAQLIFDFQFSLHPPQVVTSPEIGCILCRIGTAELDSEKSESESEEILHTDTTDLPPTLAEELGIPLPLSRLAVSILLVL
jgi:uncharacterized metal-binding protein YceD (DUF177 family)